MEIVFVRTEYDYQSYTDFWRLVELSGIPWIYVKDFDLARDYVGLLPVVNGELRPHVSHRRSILKGPQWARLISWCLERPDSGNHSLDKVSKEGVSNSTNEILEYVDAVWVSDRHWASLDPRLIYVPLGSDARLAEGPPRERIYDACALSYNNHRRDQIYGPLGQRIKMSPNSAWGAERDRILNSSKSMVYVHQTPMPIGAPLRFALAAAYKLPLLSENLADPYPLRDGHDVLVASHGELLGRIPSWLERSDLMQFGERLHETLCRTLNFKKCVLEGVEKTLAVL